MSVDLLIEPGQAPAPFAVAAAPACELRPARAEDAPAIHALIQAHLEEGHLLPRSLDELSVRAPRFVVAVLGDRIVACAELAPLSARVAEVRSLVVHADVRHEGLGGQLVEALRRRARLDGFETLCAFTHGPGFFVRPRLHHRSAPLGAGEDPRRLPGLPAVPPLRATRGDAAAPVQAGRGMTTAMSSNLTAVAGGVTAPRGFRAAGLHCGIKANGRPDLSLVVCEDLATAAGVFTLNLAQAAPVLVSKAHLSASGSRVRAVVTNSGCANACTGPQGLADAREMAALTAAVLGCAPTDVLVASTGVIGVNLKMAALRTGIPAAAARLSADGGADAADAIMTTDPFPKSAAVEVDDAAGHVPGRRHGQGLGDDRAAHGDDARLPDH